MFLRLWGCCVADLKSLLEVAGLDVGYTCDSRWCCAEEFLGMEVEQFANTCVMPVSSGEFDVDLVEPENVLFRLSVLFVKKKGNQENNKNQGFKGRIETRTLINNDWSVNMYILL